MSKNIEYINKYKGSKSMSIAFLFLMLFETFFPSISYALTTGPTQPEVNGFAQYGTSDMVDPFTGSFTYNIPLFVVPGPDGGYPVNLVYNSGITMDQEASWVGLGWSLNVGSLNRELRGLPDDFSGEEIKSKKYILPNKTIGAGLSVNLAPEIEIAGVATKDFLDFSQGIKVYYNNYNGFGFTREGGFSISHAGESGVGGSIGLNLSQDNIEGGNITPSIGLTYKKEEGDKKTKGNLTLGLNFSSRYGLQNISLNAGVSQSKEDKFKKDSSTGKKTDKERGGLGDGNLLSANFSFAGGATTPSIKDEIITKGGNISFQIGGEATVININGEVNGFWNKEELKNNNNWVSNKAFGFNYLQDSLFSEHSIMDFNRSLDQPVSPYVKILAQPSLGYDIFSIQGQGIGANIRPYRSDIGMLKEDSKESEGSNNSFGLELDYGNLVHPGASGYTGINESTSNNWQSSENDIHSIFKFKEFEENKPSYQPVAYQAYGEKHALDKKETESLIQGFRPSFIKIAPSSKSDFKLTGSVFNNGNALIQPQANTTNERIPRNINIQQFKNKDLSNEDELLKELDVKYTTIGNSTYDLNNFDKLLDRNFNSANQIGAFVATATNGLKYNYALPVLNLQSTECIYSAEKINNNEYFVECAGNTDPNYNIAGYETYFSKEIVPAYTHSFLLTSIIGTDYIDIDNNGISDRDLGYWVKFNYVKTNGSENGIDTYKWRAPFKGGNYNEGLLSKNRDDKGSYLYGERENFYISVIETKTHVAEFYISPRKDAKGAEKEIQSLNGNYTNGSSSYKLDSIKLFTKVERYNSNGDINLNAIPIQTTYFEYASYPGRFSNTEELCKGIYNAEANRGKLTLKSIWTAYRNNEREKENNYEFNYAFSNPNYDPNAANRWGDYQPDGDQGYPINKYFPYVHQNISKTELDERSSVWNLEEVILPTGAKTKVNYEAKDYAFVQNKKAMQMYKIAALGSSVNLTTAIQQYDYWNNGDVYFLMEGVNDINEAKQAVKEYIDNTGQLYYSTKVDLTNRGDWEYVSGYANIKGTDAIYENGKYYGKIILEPQEAKSVLGWIHPFTVAAWNYLLLNRPEIIQDNNIILDDPENMGTGKMIASMIKIITISLLEVLPFSRNYYSRANAKSFGAKIDLNNSFIRLNNVTGFKYGGGTRVKSIELIGEDINGTLDTIGMVYDYTTIDEKTGKIISSGVATYEPMIGGDENALKKAMFYENRVAMRNYIPTFAELPINENYYPGPSIGYSKVTTKTIATNKVINGDLPATILTTGETVDEFYTAKDFPTITDYTPLVNSSNLLKGNLLHYKHTIPIPILGSFVNEQLAISQGFYIELNDMHGKPKAIKTFAQDITGKIIDSIPISYESYIYKSEPVIANGIIANKLVNNTKVMYNQNQIEDKLLGIDVEYFGDARKSNAESTTYGGRFNTDAFMAGMIPIAILSLIPTIGSNKKGVQLATTNKVIHRFGILDSIITYNEGSLVKTSNEVFDAYTGNPILTKLNDEYGNNTYNFSVPAYWEYQNMGLASSNAAMKFTATIDSQNIDNDYIGLVVPEIKVLDYLNNGDLIAIDNGYNLSVAYIIQVDKNKSLFWVDTKAQYGIELLQKDEVSCVIINSGKKNILTPNAETIISKINPIENQTNFNCKP